MANISRNNSNPVVSKKQINDLFNTDIYANVLLEELRNHFEIPKKYQLVDFFGALLGAYFLYDGIKSKKWINIALASLMLYTHTIKFFYAPKITFKD
jgi:hypothetical protein